MYSTIPDVSIYKNFGIKKKRNTKEYICEIFDKERDGNFDFIKFFWFKVYAVS